MPPETPFRPPDPSAPPVPADELARERAPDAGPLIEIGPSEIEIERGIDDATAPSTPPEAELPPD